MDALKILFDVWAVGAICTAVITSFIIDANYDKLKYQAERKLNNGRRITWFHVIASIVCIAIIWPIIVIDIFCKKK